MGRKKDKQTQIRGKKKLIKFTLEQGTKAQRVSRCIALLFL
jgi:hypothetical protein